jgi:hypothetical protein
MAHRFFVRSETTVHDLKALINLKLKIPMDIFFLSFAGKLLSDDGKLLTDYAIVNDSRIVLDIRGFGGGKRARTAASKNIGGKEEVMKEILEVIGREALRINASAEIVPIFQQMVQEVTQICADAQQGGVVCADRLRRLSSQQLVTLQQKLNSTNGEYKMRAWSSMNWHLEFSRLNEMKRVVDAVEVLLHTASEFMMMNDYATPEGSMAWETLTTDLMRLAAAHGAAAARNAPNHLDGGAR